MRLDHASIGLDQTCHGGSFARRDISTGNCRKYCPHRRHAIGCRLCLRKGKREQPFFDRRGDTLDAQSQTGGIPRKRIVYYLPKDLLGFITDHLFC
jgi:hypothetical protein